MTEKKAPKKGLSLKWLEVFHLLTQRGSVSAVARETGLSVSTVSHHLRSLEDHLGTALIEHSRRPMSLTPAGLVFKKHIEEALALIHKAELAVAHGDLSQARHLRIGLIEDFDSEIAPELVVRLAAEMPNCDFIHYTRSSHDILKLLRNHDIDVGVVSRPNEDILDLQEYPLLCDPFVIAVPNDAPYTAEELLENRTELPFLRYLKSQFINRQIEAQLRRLKYTLPSRFETESNQSMMAMVAEAKGWAITTPLCYLRAQRFHQQTKLLPLPARASFSRHLSLFTSPECPDSVAEPMSQAFRHLISERAIEPLLQTSPWLEGMFELQQEV